MSTAPMKPPISIYPILAGRSAVLTDRTLGAKSQINLLEAACPWENFSFVVSVYFKKKMDNHSISCFIVWFYRLKNKVYLKCLVS